MLQEYVCLRSKHVAKELAPIFHLELCMAIYMMAL